MHLQVSPTALIQVDDGAGFLQFLELFLGTRQICIRNLCERFRSVCNVLETKRLVKDELARDLDTELELGQLVWLKLARELLIKGALRPA